MPVGSRRLPVEPIDGAIGFVTATVCIGVWFGFTMSLLLQARERYHADREQLTDLSVVAELTSIAETEVLAALTTSFTHYLASPLAQFEPIRDELQGRLVELSGRVATTVARVVKQCFANAVRHGDAANVRAVICPSPSVAHSLT